jgi:O-antigen/teichoic acid export membrane protein
MSWSVGCQLVSFVAGFGGSLIIARLLSPTEMGLNAIAVAMMGVVQIVATFGISSYVIRDADLQPSTLDLAFSVNALLSILLSAILFAASPFSATLLGDGRAGEVLRLLAITPLLNMLHFRASTMLQRDMRFKAHAVILMAQVVVTSSVTIAGALAGMSYLSSATGSLVGTIVTTLLFNLAAAHHFALRLTFRGWRKIARFGLEVMSVSGVAILAARLSEIILGRVLGIAALGIYSRASTISNLLFDNLYGTATRVIFSYLAREQRERGEIGGPFLRMLEMLLAVMWPIQVGLALLSAPAIYWLFGPQWHGAALPLSLLMIAQAVVLSFGMNWELFVLKGETARQARLEFWRALIGMGTFAAGCQLGLGGAAAGRIADATVGHILYRGHIDRLAGVTRAQTAPVFRRSIVLTIAATAPSLMLMIWAGWSAHVSPLLVAASVGLGVLLWGLCLRRMGHPILDLLPARLHRVGRGMARSR